MKRKVMGVQLKKLDILAVVPARGGSKGVYQKNVKRLNGKPLIAHTVGQAVRSRYIRRCIVSTNDQQIGRIARKYGAEVIQRPAATRGGKASSEAAIIHALKVLKEREKYRPDVIVFLQATSPLRGTREIDRAIEQFYADRADALFSACPLHGFVWKEKRGRYDPVTYNFKKRPMRQEMAKHYIENGSIYIFKTNILDRYKNRLGGKITLYEMSPLKSFQIDTESDMKIMKKLIRAGQR